MLGHVGAAAQNKGVLITYAHMHLGEYIEYPNRQLHIKFKNLNLASRFSSNHHSETYFDLLLYPSTNQIPEANV